jgi:hypothetical protein
VVACTWGTHARIVVQGFRIVVQCGRQTCGNRFALHPLRHQQGLHFFRHLSVQMKMKNEHSHMGSQRFATIHDPAFKVGQAEGSRFTSSRCVVLSSLAVDDRVSQKILGARRWYMSWIGYLVSGLRLSVVNMRRHSSTRAALPVCPRDGKETVIGRWSCAPTTDHAGLCACPVPCAEANFACPFSAFAYVSKRSAASACPTAADAAAASSAWATASTSPWAARCPQAPQGQDYQRRVGSGRRVQGRAGRRR